MVVYVFHNLKAEYEREYEKDRSYNAVCDIVEHK